MTQDIENAGAAIDSVANPLIEEMSIMEIIQESNSWYILIPLLLMSIYAIFVFVERFLALQKASNDEEQFMSRIKDYVQEGKLDAAKNLCTTTDSPVARMVDKGVSRIGKPMQDIKAAVENVGKLEI